METTIPFSGFYHSLHSDVLDQALEMAVTDDRGNVYSQGLFDLAFGSIDWGVAHRHYAESYCEAFAAEYGIKLKFVDLSSPKYYNYTTDRIFAEIELSEVERLFAAVDKKVLERVVKEHFTSYDGFISHYSNSLENWGTDLAAWDHNQVGTLIQAYVESEGDPDQFEVNWDSHEKAYNAIDAAITDSRAFKIADYLRNRENRNYKNNPKGF